MENNVLTLVARIEAKSEHIDLVKTELVKLIKPTRREDGCLQYDLHQDNQRPEIFLFYENWASHEQWQAHMNNEHLKQYMKATDGAVENFDCYEMSKIISDR